MDEPILTIDEREAINSGRWFSTLSPSLRHDILRCAYVKRYKDGELIAARAVMGLGAALIFPATLSLLTNVFTERGERARAIGLWGAIIGGIVGAIVGVPVPIIGSVIGAFVGSFVGALAFEYSRRDATAGTATRVATMLR